MKTPRDISGGELARALGRLGYEITRQTGSHLRLTRRVGGEHHITIPNHTRVKIGTLNSILNEVAEHCGLSKEELLKALFP